MVFVEEKRNTGTHKTHKPFNIRNSTYKHTHTHIHAKLLAYNFLFASSSRLCQLINIFAAVVWIRNEAETWLNVTQENTYTHKQPSPSVGRFGLSIQDGFEELCRKCPAFFIYHKTPLTVRHDNTGCLRCNFIDNVSAPHFRSVILYVTLLCKKNNIKNHIQRAHSRIPCILSSINILCARL
jgi:hypothetical protein